MQIFSSGFGLSPTQWIFKSAPIAMREKQPLFFKMTAKIENKDRKKTKKDWI